jgi:hypothetical protein
MSSTVRLVENSTTLPISQNAVPSQAPCSPLRASPWSLMKSKLSASVPPAPTVTNVSVMNTRSATPPMTKNVQNCSRLATFHQPRQRRMFSSSRRKK